MVLGAGVVGTSTANFLSQRSVHVTLVDRVGIAPAASGNAGGSLAEDWVAPALLPFAAASFALHRSLEVTLGAEEIDYCSLTVSSVTLRQPTKELRRSRAQRVLHDYPA